MFATEANGTLLSGLERSEPQIGSLVYKKPRWRGYFQTFLARLPNMASPQSQKPSTPRRLFMSHVSIPPRPQRSPLSENASDLQAPLTCKDKGKDRLVERCRQCERADQACVPPRGQSGYVSCHTLTRAQHLKTRQKTCPTRPTGQALPLPCQRCHEQGFECQPPASTRSSPSPVPSSPTFDWQYSRSASPQMVLSNPAQPPTPPAQEGPIDALQGRVSNRVVCSTHVLL